MTLERPEKTDVMANAMGKTAVIDVGGGFRGIYAAAVLDRCLDDGVSFDLGIGVSAGGGNIASFIAGQRGRNRRFYAEYGSRKEYAGLGCFLAHRNFLNLDYIYGTLCTHDGEDPLDFGAFTDSPMDFIVVATDAATGKPMYFPKSRMRQDDYDVLKASSAIPAACKPYRIDGRPYFDGALGDPVPVAKALELGCEKIVLLLTKPRDTVRTSEQDEKVARFIERKYPNAAAGFRQRATRYNESVAFAKKLEAQGRALIVAPDDTCGVSTLSRKKGPLDALYAKGYADGAAIAAFLGR